MSESRKTLSGIVGVDAWKTTNKALLALISALVLFSSVVAPGVAFAEPEVPSPTPIPTVEVPAAPPAQEQPPAEAPAPAPAPAPPAAPPPPAAEPAPAPAPAAPPAEAPAAPPAEAPGPAPQQPAPVTPPAPAPVTTTVPAPTSQAPAPTSAAPEQPATTSSTPAPAPTSAAAPSPTDSPTTTSRAESPQQPAGEGNDSGSEQQAPADQGESNQPNETNQSGTPPAENGTSTTVTTSPTSEPAESSTPVVEEAPVATPVDVATQEGAKVFSEDALIPDVPTEGQVASQETVAAVDDAILAAAYAASDRDPRDRDNDGKDGKGRDNNHKPRDPDPKGWKCNDRRGAYGCPWNDWHHDAKGRPVFNNQFTFDLKVVYFDGFNRVEVVVRAGTQRSINTPGSGAYAFVVVGVSNPNFAVNVGVGVFNSDSNCNRGCGRPATTQIGVFVNVSNRNVYYPRVDAYDCGCGVTYGNRYYDRIYVGGTREVIGNWVEPQGQPRYFQPWGYKESPASPAYVQGPPPEFAGYGKLGANPDGTTTSEALPPVDTTNRALQIAAAVGIAVLILGGGGLLLVQRSRRNRRVNEP